MKQTKTTKIALVSILAASSVVLGYFYKNPDTNWISNTFGRWSLLHSLLLWQS